MHWIDPASLPETKGKVSRFLLNPRGEIDGLLLAPATLVHLPPHLTPLIMAHVAAGSTVKVRAVKPRGADLLAAVSLTAADGTVITDNGPDKPKDGGHKTKHPKRPKPERESGEVAGRVLLSLHGPKGELRGALLEDGISLRMAPEGAAELAEYLAPGVAVRSWGKIVTTPHGSTMEVEEIALDAADT